MPPLFAYFQAKSGVFLPKSVALKHSFFMRKNPADNPTFAHFFNQF